MRRKTLIIRVLLLLVIGLNLIFGMAALACDDDSSLPDGFCFDHEGILPEQVFVLFPLQLQQTAWYEVSRESSLPQSLIPDLERHEKSPPIFLVPSIR